MHGGVGPARAAPISQLDGSVRGQRGLKRRCGAGMTADNEALPVAPHGEESPKRPVVRHAGTSRRRRQVPREEIVGGGVACTGGQVTV